LNSGAAGLTGGGLADRDGGPVRVGGAAAGSQEGRAAPGGVSSPRGVGSYGQSGFSSDGGAPWNGLTAAPPANSAQGKGLWGLAEVSG
jgi:hypothetical protein